jgi:putative hydrolase of the HAD superfamily
MQSLELKPGVMGLFAVLKRYGKGIAIVTEGPQDAQERTVEALGLATRIDYLATTNKFGVAKVDGLFERVVEELEIGAGEVVVVGDSWERDVLPAAKAGAFCVHYDEGSLRGGEIAEGWRVGRLEELRVLVEAAHSEFEIQSDL